jgi:F-type H+-transporting ATPase subunit a
VNIYAPLEHAVHLSWVVQAAILAGIVLSVGGLMVRSRLASGDAGIVPDSGVTLRNILEVLVEWLAGLAEQAIGHDWKKWFPIVGTIFFFILISNLMGLLPGIGGATSDVNAGLAWALIAFGVYTFAGIQKHGWRYIHQFMGPAFDVTIGGKHRHVRILAPFMMMIEIPLNLARVVTLTIRLLANMFADHTVLSVWLGLVPIAIPAVFLGLGLLVSVIQAFVFSLLTMIYIGLALEEAH